MFEQGVRQVQKRKEKNGNLVLDIYQLKSPFDKRFASHYPLGELGDENCKRIVIDGSNVARSHGKVGEIKRKHGFEVFSILGIKIAVEEFWKMGCRKVTVFLPQNRQGNKGSPLIPEKEEAYYF
jgi:hypothetical protein